MKQGTISINAVENGYTINVQAGYESEQKNVLRSMNRQLVAVGDADAKKKLHEVVDALFEAPKEAAKMAGRGSA